MSYRSNDTFGVFLAHSVRKLWSLLGLPASIVATRALKLVQKFCKLKTFFFLGRIWKGRIPYDVVKSVRGTTTLKNETE